MRFGAWNMRAGSLSKVARYRLDLVGVQEVWWDKGGHGKSRGL